MNTHRIFLGLIVIALCLTMMSLHIEKTHAQNQTPGVQPMNTQQQYRGPYDDLNDAASQVVPEDENSIRVLANAVFDFPHSYPHMPADIEATAKDRLIQAEKAYMQKRGPGVQEHAVVNTINTLAEKFAVPEYAKTSALQVRYIRMTAALGAPNFMGQGVARPGTKIGDSIGTEMSPIQAAHLMAVVIDQKFINPDFQVPPDEWDRGFQGLSDKLQAEQDAQASGAPRTARLRVRVNSNRQSLNDTVWKGLSSLSANDGSDLVKQMFTNLGIQ